jgi:predicted permease
MELSSRLPATAALSGRKVAPCARWIGGRLSLRKLQTGCKLFGVIYNIIFYVFVPCIVIQLCNVNQQNALFKLMFHFISAFQ